MAFFGNKKYTQKCFLAHWCISKTAGSFSYRILEHTHKMLPPVLLDLDKKCRFGIFVQTFTFPVGGRGVGDIENTFLVKNETILSIQSKLIWFCNRRPKWQFCGPMKFKFTYLLIVSNIRVGLNDRSPGPRKPKTKYIFSTSFFEKEKLKRKILEKN